MQIISRSWRFSRPRFEEFFLSLRIIFRFSRILRFSNFVNALIRSNRFCLLEASVSTASVACKRISKFSSWGVQVVVALAEEASGMACNATVERVFWNWPNSSFWVTSDGFCFYKMLPFYYFAIIRCEFGLLWGRQASVSQGE